LYKDAPKTRADNPTYAGLTQEEQSQAFQLSQFNGISVHTNADDNTVYMTDASGAVISGDKHQTAAEVAAAAATAAAPTPAEAVTYHKAETNGMFTEAGDMWMSTSGTKQDVDPLVDGQTLTLADGNFNVQNSNAVVPQGTYTVMTFNKNTDLPIKALKAADGTMYFLTSPNYTPNRNQTQPPYTSYDEKTGIIATSQALDGSTILTDSRGVTLKRLKDGSLTDGNTSIKMPYKETQDANGKVLFVIG
jgi:hypothetical protein